MSIQDVFQALALLQPYEVPGAEKIRLGGCEDGSYILVNNLRPAQKILSFGIGWTVDFELDLAERGHVVHLFDPTIDQLPKQHANFHFYKEGIAGSEQWDQACFTLATHLRKLDLAEQDLVLKMDVEGAEWDAIDTVPVTTLAKFEQLALEIHGLHRLSEGQFRDKFCRCLRKINSLFSLCHVHANNYAPITMVEGFPVCGVMELTYIRKNLFQTAPSLTLYPTGLDEPNNKAAPDHLLWFFPFYPTGRGPEKTQALTEMTLTVRRLHAETEANSWRSRTTELQRELQGAKRPGGSA